MSDIKCACRGTDRYECIRIRYGINDEDEEIEPCECICHDEDDEDAP